MSVQRRERGGKVRYVARYRDSSGKEHSRTFDRRRDAVTWTAERQAEVRTGTWVPPEVQSMTVEQWCETWFRGRTGIAPSTLEQYRTILDLDVLPALGALPIRSLTTSTCRAWVRELTTTRSWRDPVPVTADGALTGELRPDALATSTASTRAHVFASICKEAVAEGVILRSPMLGVKSPKRPVEDTAVDPELLPTAEEIWALRDAASELIAEAIIVAAGTGLRQGELLGLRVKNAQPLRREIVVVEQADPRGDGVDGWRATKTRQARRRLPAGDVVTEAIARHLARFPAEVDQPVFRNRYGQMHRRSAFGELWRDARAAAGVRESLRWHELRHYYASTLIAGGASVREVMERMGHTSAEETIARYSRLWPEREETTRSIIDAALARPGVGELRALN